MIRVDKLRGIIAERAISHSEVARHIGVTYTTFYRKMKRGVFDSDEICKMIELLSIEDPAAIFFAHDGT